VEREHIEVSKETGEPRVVILQGLRRDLLHIGVKNTLGLDIGSHTLKAVEIRGGLREQSLAFVGVIELALEAIAQEQGMEEMRASSLHRILNRIDTRHTRIVTSVGGPSVVVRQIRMPLLPRKKFLSSLRWEVRRHIPFKEEIVFDAQVLATDKKGKQMDVLVAVMIKEEMDAYLNLLSKVNIRPDVVDIGPLAIMNCLLKKNHIQDSQTIVVLEMGARCTNLSIFSKEDSFFNRCIPIAGNRFTQELQDRLGVSYQEAEVFKKGQETDILHSIKHTVDLLITEIYQSLRYYKGQTKKDKLDKIVLAGGSARLTGLSSYIEKELNLPVEIFNPFEGLRIDERALSLSLLKNLAPQLSLAVGLAMRK